MPRVFTDAGAMKLITDLHRIAVDASFSVAFWIQRTATPAAQRSLITAVDPVIATCGWAIRLTTGNLIQAVQAFATANKTRNSTTAPALNTWVHVIVAHNSTGTASTDFVFYIDGKLEAGANVSAGSGARDANTAVPIEIGASAGDGTTAAPVHIGPVAVWSRALSPAEALALATGAHPTRFKESLVELFDNDTSGFEEGSQYKMLLVPGSTNPVNTGSVRPPMEGVPFLFETRPNVLPRSRARARYIANAAAGGAVLNDHNYRRVGRGVGVGVMRGAA